MGARGDQADAEEPVGGDDAFVVADRGGDVSGDVGALAVAGEQEIGVVAAVGDGLEVGVGGVDAGVFGGRVAAAVGAADDCCRVGRVVGGERDFGCGFGRFGDG